LFSQEKENHPAIFSANISLQNKIYCTAGGKVSADVVENNISRCLLRLLLTFGSPTSALFYADTGMQFDVNHLLDLQSP